MRGKIHLKSKRGRKNPISFERGTERGVGDTEKVRDGGDFKKKVVPFLIAIPSLWLSNVHYVIDQV